MRRGQTTTLDFKIPESITDIKRSRIVLKQSNYRKVFEDEEITKSPGALQIRLDQDDTLRFDEGFFEAQVRIVDVHENAYASNIVRVNVERTLDDEVL